MFVSVDSNQDANSKRFKTGRYYSRKGIIKNCSCRWKMEKLLWPTHQFWYKKIWREIRKLTTSYGEDYTTGCLSGYEYFINHYRLMAVDLSRQKELDANQKEILQIEFVGQLKTPVNAIVITNLYFLNTFRKKSKKLDWNFLKEA